MSITFSCTETIDLVKAQTIRDNWDSLSCKVGRFIDATKGYKYIEDKAAFTIIDKYVKARSKSFTADYKYSGKKTEGRQFSIGASLQNLSRPFRHTIAGEFYDDLDVVNCHPMIFQQLADKLGLATDHLRYYNENRQECLQELMNTNDISKDDAKKVMLSVMNGGGDTSIDFKETSWLTSYFKQCETLRTHLLSLPEYKPYFTAAKRNKSSGFNIEGTAINHVFLKFENEILLVILDYCKVNKIRVGALCYDGLMMYKDPDRNNNRVIKDLERLIKTKTGFILQLAIKPMTEGFSLDGFVIKEKAPKILSGEPGSFNTDLDAADTAEKLMKADVKITWEAGDSFYGFIWNPKTLLWETKKKEALQAYIFDCLIKEAERIISTVSDDQTMVGVLTKSLSKLKSASGQRGIFQLCISRFQDTNFKSQVNPHNNPYLSLQGGILYNMQTGVSRARVQSDYYSWEMCVSLTENRDLARSYLKDLVGEEKVNLLLSVIAYFFTHLNGMKLFYVFIGARDTGKSTFFGFIEKMMGKFSVPMSNRAIMSTKNKAVHEDELITGLNHTKMSLVKEISRGEELSSAVIKKVMGADEQTLRACGGKSITFTSITKLGMCVNVRPEYNQEMEGKLFHFEFPNQFSKSTENKKKMQDLKENSTFLDMLFSLIMDSCRKVYETGCHMPSVDDSKYITNSVEEWIEDKCELGTDTKDDPFRYSTVSAWDDYNYWLERNSKSLEDKKFFREYIEKRTGLEKSRQRYKNWKGESCNGPVYKGIRRLTEVVDNDDEKPQPRMLYCSRGMNLGVPKSSQEPEKEGAE